MRRIATMVAVAAGAAALAPAAAAGATDTPYLDAVQRTLTRLAPGLEGEAWQRTSGNTIDPPGGGPGWWLLDTPGCWGGQGCADPAGSARLVRAIRDTVASARRTVDLTTLLPLADGAFLDAIAEGLRRAQADGDRPRVRVLAGAPPTWDPLSRAASTFRDTLLARLGDQAGTTRLSVASVVTSWPLSWNHAKIVVADGRQAVVGGHNGYSGDYIQGQDPIADVSMRVAGPAAGSAARFTDVLWRAACTAAGGTGGSFSVSLAQTAAAGPCPSGASMPAGVQSDPPPGAAGVDVIGVGRLGLGVAGPAGPRVSPAQVRDLVGDENTPAGVPTGPDARSWYCRLSQADSVNDSPEFDARNPGLSAIRTLVAQARRDVVLSQQDILGPGYCLPLYDVRLLRALVNRMRDGVTVTVVISSPGARGRGTGQEYTNGQAPRTAAGAIARVAAAVVGDRAEARRLVCRRLRLATIRVGATPTWPNGTPYGNHAKLVAVDDRAFYIGSGNVYPAMLQEYGLIVDDERAGAELRREYLDPLWRSSRPAALVDDDQGRCDLG